MPSTRSPSSAHALNQPRSSFGFTSSIAASTSPTSAAPEYAAPSTLRTSKSKSSLVENPLLNV
jgi:hypothetical protein